LRLDSGMHPRVYPLFVPDEAMKMKFLRSGQLATITGVSADTLRHYEKKGVLARPHRSPSGYRLYPVQAIRRVQLIRRALQIGFTLDELAQILQIRDKDGVPCHEVKRLATVKLAEIEALLESLLSIRDTLRSLLEDWNARLE